MPAFIRRFFSYIVFARGCLFHRLTGLYCPGCGGTRAVLLLLHGHPLRSFVYHPFVLYAALGIAVLLFLRLFLRRWEEKWMQVFLWGALLVLAANFLVKNAALLLFHVNLLDAGAASVSAFYSLIRI